jgi:hypothetical protein
MLWDKTNGNATDQGAARPAVGPGAFRPKFAETVKGLPKDRRYLVNLRIEDLAAIWRARGRQRKAPLKRPGSQGTQKQPLRLSARMRRLSAGMQSAFNGHYDAREKQVFVLDRLDSALHA